MKRSRLSGYALVLVMVFMVLMLSLASVAYRQLAGMMCVEAVRSTHVVRDQGSLEALAMGLALLQTGNPPTNPYVCGVTLDTLTGPKAFTVTMSSATVGQWTVSSAPTQPGDAPVAMPSTF